MNKKLVLWSALGLATLLAGCGGETAETAQAQPDSAKESQASIIGRAAPSERSSPLAAESPGPYGNAPPLVAVEQLLDYAEAAYSAYFPSQSSTQSFEHYLYRFYPETGLYVGVAVGVQAVGGLVEGGVYVLGGQFGPDPEYVGVLTGFVTPSPCIPSFVSPAALTAVYDLGTTVDIAVAVSCGVRPAPDGTPIDFASSAGTLSSATSTVSDGSASTRLVADAVGSLDIRASEPTAGELTAAIKQVYVRPVPGPQELLVPAYYYPLPNSPWEQLISTVAARTDVVVTAIMNPSNGEFTDVDPSYAAIAPRFVAAGGKLVGYVHLRQSPAGPLRSVEAVLRDVGAYRLHYPGLMSGLFVDEAGPVGTGEGDQVALLANLSAIRSNAKANNPDWVVIANTNTVPEAFEGVADVFITAEDDAAKLNDHVIPTWMYGHSNKRFGTILHDAIGCSGTSGLRNTLLDAVKPERNSGYLYITNLIGAGAYNTLPTYWSDLLNMVSAVNRGVAVPPC